MNDKIQLRLQYLRFQSSTWYHIVMIVSIRGVKGAVFQGAVSPSVRSRTASVKLCVTVAELYVTIAELYVTIAELYVTVAKLYVTVAAIYVTVAEPHDTVPLRDLTILTFSAEMCTRW